MADVLHTDDPAREGNLTAEEYEATYTEPGTEGPCHTWPDGLIDQLARDLGGDHD